MTDITHTIASDINRLHDLASQRAAEAIDYAKQVGLLLIEAKASVKHGDWLPWLAQNVRVSARQAQRYIAIAEGKPVPVRQLATKSDAVSHSEVNAPRNLPGAPEPSGFIPEVCNCYATLQPDGTLYVVEPSSRWSGFFFVTRLYQDGETYDCTRRPVRADFVAENLAYYGMADAASASWKVKPSPGVLEALGTFEEMAA
ncbi:MAG: hypothetical protein DI587_22260 [Variovorax paradoxus]|nr:MAG: hypothetical protein DI583_22260 [Variovorax paradoxus]PZQ06397.1 MAG: hypothetical protein DI587_22260 [Variovorax paradoxus]